MFLSKQWKSIGSKTTFGPHWLFKISAVIILKAVIVCSSYSQHDVSISKSLLLVCHLLELPIVCWIREHPWSQLASVLQQRANALVSFCLAMATVASLKYDFPLRWHLQGVHIHPEHPSFAPSSSSLCFILTDCLLTGYCKVFPRAVDDRWACGAARDRMRRICTVM